MRRLLYVSSVVLAATFSSALFAQASSPIPQQLLQQSAALLSGGAPIVDVEMKGSAIRHDGSQSESGAVFLTGIGYQQSEWLASMPSGTYLEKRSSAGASLAGQGSGPGNVSYTISPLDLDSSAAWFFPYFVVNSGANSGDFASAFVGLESLNGTQVYHIQVWQKQPNGSELQAAALQQLSREDVFLDASSLLPVATRRAQSGVPIEIDFSNYVASSQGARVPSRINLVINGSLAWQINIQSITINAGTSALP